MNQQGEYTITTDRGMMQITAIHAWLSTKSHWAIGLPFDLMERAFNNSFCAGAFYNGQQIGFARLITDYATFGYLADVYVEEEHRGKGLARKMCKVILEQDWAVGLRRIMLATKDAQGVYAPLGFSTPRYPERLMEILHLNPYQTQ